MHEEDTQTGEINWQRWRTCIHLSALRYYKKNWGFGDIFSFWFFKIKLFPELVVLYFQTLLQKPSRLLKPCHMRSTRILSSIFLSCGMWHIFLLTHLLWDSFSVLCLATSTEGHFSYRRPARYFNKCHGYFLFSFSFGSMVKMRRSIVAVSAAVLAGSAILVAASATSAMSSLETGAKFRWRSSGKKWCNMSLVSDGQPELGSWLDVKQQPWGVGCKVCKETGVSNPFASYSMTKKGQLQNCNLMKHHKSKAHRAAVKEWLKEGGCVGPSPDEALSLSQFQELMECFGEKRSLTQKELQMAWCLAEGLKALDQKFIAKSSHISLMRDERHGRLTVRFMAVAPDLTTRSGFLGQARQAGTGADNVSLATWAVMKRACSRFYMAPLSQNPGRLKKNLFKHLRSRVVALAADAASDEMASCEILRSGHLSLNTEDNQPMLPNLRSEVDNRLRIGHFSGATWVFQLTQAAAAEAWD